jgi:hypothetical protein
MRYLFLLLFTAISLLAQSQNSGSIKGIVKSNNSIPLEGIKIILDNAIQKVDSTTTDKDGMYIFYTPPVGLHYVSISDARFKSAKTLIETKAGHIVEVNLIAEAAYIIAPVVDPIITNTSPSYNDARGAVYSADDIRRLAVPR